MSLVVDETTSLVSTAACDHSDDTDAVSSTLKTAVNISVVGMCFWLVSFLLIMIDALNTPKVHWIFMLPMALGSLLIVVYILSIAFYSCTDTGLVILTAERLSHMRSRRIAGVDGTNLIYIYRDSIPLLRQFLLWSSVLLVFLLLSLYAQVWTMLRWYGAIAITSTSLWRPFSPLLIFTAMLLLILYILEDVARVTLIIVILVYLSVLLELAEAYVLAALTFLVAILIHFGRAVLVVTRASRGLIKLSLAQYVLLSGHLCGSLCCSAAASLLIILAKALPFPSVTSPAVLLMHWLWLIGVSVLVVTLISLMHRELYRIARGRGHLSPPAAVCDSVTGYWAPGERSVKYCSLVGEVNASPAVNAMRDESNA